MRFAVAQLAALEASAGALLSPALSCVSLEQATASRRLDIYLNDHLAGATMGLSLARRLRDSNAEDPELGPALAAVCADIEADLTELQSAMERLGVGKGKVKPTAALLAERLGRLKLNGQLRGYSPLSRLDELEMLQIGITGKRSLWVALRLTQAERLAGTIDLDRLIERADEQLDQVRSLHRQAAVPALT